MSAPVDPLRLWRRPPAPWSLFWVAMAILLTTFLISSVTLFALTQARVDSGLPRRVPLPDQAAAIILAFETGDVGQRDLMRRALNSSDLGVRLLETWPSERRRGELGHRWMAQTIRGYLPVDKAGLMDEAAIWFPEVQRPGWIVKAVQVIVPLSDGAILELDFRDRGIAFYYAIWTMGAWGLFALVLTGGAIIVVRRILAPLRRVAAAADQIGRDVDSPPMPEAGPAELRRVARAFNAMQQRVRDLIGQRTRMLAGIAHDLRTVLTRQRLRLEALPEPAQRAKAIADFDFMMRVIDTHLDFAKAEQALEPPTRFDLANLVIDLVEDAAAAGKNALYVGPDQAVILGRPDALRRAIANLIDNALTYGGEAEVSLRLDGTEAVVQIGDRGPGVRPADRDTIFLPYRRMSDAQALDAPHFGLGLATTRAILRRHGGDVTIADRPGGGALFIARWPG